MKNYKAWLLWISKAYLSSLFFFQSSPLSISQFNLGEDGYVSANYEHTSAEGPPVISTMDHVLNFL